MLCVCDTELRYNTTYLIVSGVKEHFRAVHGTLTGLNNNYKCDSKQLSFLFAFAKLPTSSEPSAQSKSPSHQNLEETQSPLAQRKSFNVQVCGSGDRRIAQAYSIICNCILNLYDIQHEVTLRKKRLAKQNQQIV